MRSLREKLKAVSSKQPGTSNTVSNARPDLYFVREHHVPVIQLCGIEATSLEEIKSCDPGFTGDSWDVHKLLFLDTETTGLSGGAGTVAFEILSSVNSDNLIFLKKLSASPFSILIKKDILNLSFHSFFKSSNFF